MSGATMTDIMNGFMQVCDFANTYVFYIGEFPVTFMDIWVWTCGGLLFYYALKRFYDNWT